MRSAGRRQKAGMREDLARAVGPDADELERQEAKAHLLLCHLQGVQHVGQMHERRRPVGKVHGSFTQEPDQLVLAQRSLPS